MPRPSCSLFAGSEEEARVLGQQHLIFVSPVQAAASTGEIEVMTLLLEVAGRELRESKDTLLSRRREGFDVLNRSLTMAIKACHTEVA
jgi:hypothetical protein